MNIDDDAHPKALYWSESMDLILAFDFVLNEGGT